MAKREQFRMSVSERRARRFSEGFKKQKVKEIEMGKLRVCDLVREYEVTSTNVHRWIRKFGLMKDKPARVIVETDSDTRELISLRQKIADLERIIGQKQLLLDFQNKLIELAEQTYGIDIKKKCSTPPCDTSGNTEKECL